MESHRVLLQTIANIIEGVDVRCAAADGPVTPTLQEMRPDELRRIYDLANAKTVREEDEELVICELCGKADGFSGTRRCDRCLELEKRVEMDLELAYKVIRRLWVKRLEDLCTHDGGGVREGECAVCGYVTLACLDCMVEFSRKEGSSPLDDGEDLVVVCPDCEILEELYVRNIERFRSIKRTRKRYRSHYRSQSKKSKKGSFDRALDGLSSLINTWSR